jgi:hypothetical protein
LLELSSSKTPTTTGKKELSYTAGGNAS